VNLERLLDLFKLVLFFLLLLLLLLFEHELANLLFFEDNTKAIA